MAILLFAAVCGCERGEVSSAADGTAKPSGPRTEDASYQHALAASPRAQRSLAQARAEVAAQMTRLVARARAALPKDATDEQVKDELMRHPEKYAGWRDLSRRLDELDASMKKEQDEIRQRVRARIQAEQDHFKKGGKK
jgi:hypothetical protein